MRRRGSIVNRTRQLKKERELVQKKTFCRWVNLQLTRKGKAPISDLDSGFHSGVSLCDLTEALSKKRIKSRWSRNPKSPIQMLENLSIALSYLTKKCGIKLVGIGNRSLHDGDITLTLGLVWTLILHFQIEGIQVDASGEVETEKPTATKSEETDEKDAPPRTNEKKIHVSGKKALLLWAKAHTKKELASVDHVPVKNLHVSWRDGYAFNALISHFRPDLVDMEKVQKMNNDEERLKHAFEVGMEDLGLPALLDADDILEGPKPDEKAVTTYLAELFRLFQNAKPVPKPEPAPPPPTPEPKKEKVVVRKLRCVPPARPSSQTVRDEVRRITRHANFEKATTGTALIVDMGTSTLCVGFSGDEAPRSEVPVVVGRHYLPKVPEPGFGILGFEISIGDDDDDDGDDFDGMDEKNDGDDDDDDDDVVVGSAAVLTSTRGILRLSTPMSRGVVTNWTDMERVWQVSYEHVNADTERHDAIVHEAALNPTSHTERVMTMHFESFGCPSIFIAPPAGYLSLLRGGRTTGVGLDSGAGITQIASVVDGTVIRSSLKRYEWGGNDLTRLTLHRLRRDGRCASGPIPLSVASLNHQMLAASFKAQNAFVRGRDDDAKQSNVASSSTRKKYGEGEVTLSLPDGSSFSVLKNAFDVTESYFKSSDKGREIPSLNQMIADAVAASADPMTRRIMLRGITLSGGNTLTEGLVGRLEEELRDVFRGESFLIDAPHTRLSSAFTGASILYELRSFRHLFITEKEYEEFGAAAALARKRFF